MALALNNYLAKKSVLQKMFLYVKNQGDQIGPLFAPWAIVFFGRFLENYRISPH
jgi:hypothetical protein